VRLSYSTDGGSTWLPATAVDLWASEFSVTVPLEMAIEQKFEQARRIRRVFKGRIKVIVKFAQDNFGSNDTNDTKLCYVEDWQRKPLLRIWTHDGAASPAGVNVDGKSYFASATNTYYVVPDEGNEPDIESDFRKTFELKLEARDAIA
jgi:hypothetical protein